MISSDGLRVSTYVPAIAYSVLEPAEKKGILQIFRVSQASGISHIARIFHPARHSGSQVEPGVNRVSESIVNSPTPTLERQ